MRRISITTVCFLVLLSSYLKAQTFDMLSIPNEYTKIGVQYSRSKFSSNYNPSVSLFKVHANIPLGSKFNLVATLPYTKVSYGKQPDYYYQKNKQSGFGSVFIGLQSKSQKNNTSFFSFGLFLPTSSENDTFTGWINDYYNLMHYFPESYTVYVNFSTHKRLNETFRFGYELGPAFLQNISDGGAGGLMVHYGFEVSAYIHNFIFNIELVGRNIWFNISKDFFQTFNNMLNVGIHYENDFITPKLYYKFFLNSDIAENTDGILNIGFSLPINKN